MDVTAGTRVADRYVVERALAKGGMGAVFVARDTRMDARVALKVTAAGGAAADELGRRFAREARIGHRLGTGRLGFVRASDWGRIDGVQLYLVMDLVDGGRPLDLRTGTLEERVARWRRAADLVRIAHEQGVIHRDLKPANFLQAPDGAIFLTDFGLAKVKGEAGGGAGADGDGGDEPVSLTLTGVGFGTPPYMPPEQLEDAKRADERADVFALGCMLFEAAVLRLPYPGPTPTGVMGAHLKVRAGLAPAPRPRDVDPQVPDALDQACAQALELDVARRCPSVAALFALLDGAAPTRLEVGPGLAAGPRSLGAVATTPPDALPTGVAAPRAGLAPAPAPAPTGSGEARVPSGGPGPAASAAASGPAPAPGVSLLPTGAGVPTGTPRPPGAGPERSLTPSPATAPDRAPRGAAVLAAGLLLALGGAVAADVAGLRGRLLAAVAPPATEARPPATEARPPATEAPPPPPATEAPPPPPATEAPPPPPATEAPPPPATEAPPPVVPVALVALTPADGAVVPALVVDVVGRLEPPTAAVRVAGIACPVGPDGAFALRRLALDPGANRVEVEVVPEAPGQAPLRRTLALTADPDDPVLTLEAPADGLETAATSVALRGQVRDATAVEVELTGPDGAREVVARVRAGGGALAADVPLPALGRRTLEVVARDAGGRTTRVTRAVVRRAPRLALALEAPADGLETSDARVRVAGRVTGDAAAGTLEVRVDGAAVRVTSDGAFDQALPLAEGARTVEVVAAGRGPAGEPLEARERRRVRVVPAAPAWSPGRPVPWAGGPARLPAGVVRGAAEGEYVNQKDGSVLVYLPPGTFRMGSDAGAADEKPVHEVRLTRGTFVGKHEVTWGQYRAFCRATGRTAPSSVIDHQGRFEAGDTHPVFYVSWDDAQAYCGWAGLRLPTEAEWEYAARGTDGRTYPWGNEEPGTTRCNLGSGNSSDWRDGRDGHLYTAPVGSFPAGASAFGVLDQAGNVWEWVQDWYADSYPAGTQTDPTGPSSGTYRALRGGSWFFDSGYCRAALRSWNSPGSRYDTLGFRVARSAEDR